MMKDQEIEFAHGGIRVSVSTTGQRANGANEVTVAVGVGSEQPTIRMTNSEATRLHALLGWAIESSKQGSALTRG